MSDDLPVLPAKAVEIVKNKRTEGVCRQSRV